MKTLTIFNHKGGVSKTTSTFNIGWMIASMGHKVLLVDADPQCNLTSLILGEKFDSYYENEATKSQNIMDGVKPAYKAKMEQIKPILCPQPENNPNLYLIPGHMNLSEYEAQLSFSFTLSPQLSTMSSLPGAFNDLIEKTANSIEAEYIFIDMNPALSVINEDLFLISDAFIIPTNPDSFSLMALKSLASILPRWKAWKESNIALFADSAYPLPAGTPKFIGQIPQRFNIRNGKPTRPYQEKIEDLKEIALKELLPALKNAGMLFDTDAYTNAGIDTNSYILHEIKDFQTLSPTSLQAKVPVFALTDEQLGTQGSVLEGQRKNVQAFFGIYSEIANQIINILK